MQRAASPLPGFGESRKKRFSLFCEPPQAARKILQQPCLWPLALLTKGKVDRILIETMFAELLEQKLYNMLPIGHTIAAWCLRDDDLSWLHQEYQKMFEIFKDSPALQWMEDSVREEERKKAQLQLQEERKKARQQLRAEQKKAEQQLHAEQKKAEQQLRAEQKKAERRLQEKDKKALATFQQMVIGLVSQRFPTLLRLAKAQVHLLKQPERFQEVILRLSLARDIDEAQEILYSFNENETEEDTEEPL